MRTCTPEARGVPDSTGVGAQAQTPGKATEGICTLEGCQKPLFCKLAIQNPKSKIQNQTQPTTAFTFGATLVFVWACSTSRQTGASAFLRDQKTTSNSPHHAKTTSMS